MRDVVIVGGGFAGLATAGAIEEALEGRRRTRLTLVSDQAYFLFTPMLPRVAAGGIQLPGVSVPLSGRLRNDTRLVIDRVEGIDLDRRELVTRRNRINFDFLVMAPGSRVDWGAHPEWAEHSHVCKSGRDAMHLREIFVDALQSASEIQNSEDRRMQLTFVTVGGGPAGVEITAELASWFATEWRARLDPRIASEVRFVLIEKRASVLPFFGAELRKLAHSALNELGVEVHIGTSAKSIGPREVELSTGSVIEADHVIWCGGVRGSDLIADSGLATDERGRALVSATLEVPNHPRIFLAGDSARPTDAPAPCNAQAAVQQGKLAAKNVVALLSGRSQNRWSYRRYGDLISLGRQNAAVNYRGMVLDGKAARTLHDAIYAALIPSPLKKVSLLRDLFAASRNESLSEDRLLSED